MKTLNELCIPKKSIFNLQTADTTLDITSLALGQIDPHSFFSENYITSGLENLYKHIMRRYEGTGENGVFRLKQSMGGGKTHCMIAMGLLAQFPDLRHTYMSSAYNTTFNEPVKVIAISGRENYEFGIWGYIAEKINKSEKFNAHYSPLSAPGQTAWRELLNDEKVLILIDELPPYLSAAKGSIVGNSDLADITCTALTNLFNAITQGLNSVTVIISDLNANYNIASAQINAIFSNIRDLDDETTRLAYNIQPVSQSGNEIFEILRKKLFEKLPVKSEIEDIAEAYGNIVNTYEKQGLVRETKIRFKENVLESYPFHPMLKSLLENIKENENFQQTRGLLRLMRRFLARIYSEHSPTANKIFLIHPYEYYFEDIETFNMFSEINPTLKNAISHDIYNNGNSTAENLDREKNNDLFLKTVKVIFFSSLPNVKNSRIGIDQGDIIISLICPGQNIVQFKEDVLSVLHSECWYLHISNQNLYHFKNIQNVSAQIQHLVKGYDLDQKDRFIRSELERLFESKTKDVYQKVFILPALDQIKSEADNVALIIFNPNDRAGLHPELKEFYNKQEFKNRFLFVSGERKTLNEVRENVSKIKAAETVIREFQSEGIAENSEYIKDAETHLDKFRLLFYSSLRETFVDMYYPAKEDLENVSIAMDFVMNAYEVSEQIKKTLINEQKFVQSPKAQDYTRQMEAKLFNYQKKLPYKEVLRNAACNSAWIFCEPKALERMIDENINNDIWSKEGEWIVTQPQPKIPSVTIIRNSRDPVTGVCNLKLSLSNADTLFYDHSENVSINSSKVTNLLSFEMNCMNLYFLPFDSKNNVKGEIKHYKNTLDLKGEINPHGVQFEIEFKTIPDSAKIYFTSDGSNPESGELYTGKIYRDTNIKVIHAIAIKEEVRSEVLKLSAPIIGDSGKPEPPEDAKVFIEFDPSYSIDATNRVFDFIKLMKSYSAETNIFNIEIVQDDKYILLDFDFNSKYKSEFIENTINFIREQSNIFGKVAMVVNKIYFERYSDLKKCLKELEIPYELHQIKELD